MYTTLPRQLLQTLLSFQMHVLDRERDSLFQYQSPRDCTLPANLSVLQNQLEVLLKYRLVDPQVQSL